MKFDWDEQKRLKILSERNLDISDLTEAFLDPGGLEWRDLRRDYGEQRFNLIAKCRGKLYHFAFTFRGDKIRIITARRANERERRRYDWPS
jgi:uncharacterized DUF497 family protein